MHLFVKLWNPKPLWLSMDLDGRVNYLKLAQRGMEQISKKGIETIAWFKVEGKDPEFDSGYQYCSVYKMKNAEDVEAFHEIMRGYDWYDYFEQVNVSGEIASPGAVLENIMNLDQQSEEG